MGVSRTLDYCYFCNILPILHYALGLRFGKVCEQKREKNARKMQEKCKKNARKTQAKVRDKRNWLASYQTYIVI